MTTAVEWELENAENLKAMAEAFDNKDRYLAQDILDSIAPLPEGIAPDALKEIHDGYFDRVIEITDSKTGKIDNRYGPAVVEGDGTRKWYRAGLLHNSHGPAVVKLTGKFKYYYLGERYKTAAELDEVAEQARRHNEKSKHYRNTAA